MDSSFNPDMKKRGLYFCQFEDIQKYITNSSRYRNADVSYILKVNVPIDAVVYLNNDIYHGSYKANKLELSDLKHFDELDEWNDFELCKKALSKCGMLIRYIIKDRNRFSDELFHELFIIAVKNDGNALEHIPFDKQDFTICFCAVNKFGRSLRYVKPELKTKEICLAAARQNKFATQHFPKNMKSKLDFELGKIQYP